MKAEKLKMKLKSNEKVVYTLVSHAVLLLNELGDLKLTILKAEIGYSKIRILSNRIKCFVNPAYFNA